MGVVIVEGKGQFWNEFGVSHCNQWGRCVCSRPDSVELAASARDHQHAVCTNP